MSLGVLIETLFICFDMVGVGGSNPLAPTSKYGRSSGFGALFLLPDFLLNTNVTPVHVFVWSKPDQEAKPDD